MLIEVWSDVVCPWCYIGKRRLDKAIAMFDHRDQVTVMHRAFQLQPDAQGVHPTKQHLADKYGVSEAQVEQMQQNVCDIATGEGLCYDLSNTVSGNTKDAHRLLLWAADSGKQDELLKAMYAGYFEQGKSLFTHDDLLALVVDAGLDRDAAAAGGERAHRHAVLQGPRCAVRRRALRAGQLQRRREPRGAVDEGVAGPAAG